MTAWTERPFIFLHANPRDTYLATAASIAVDLRGDRTQYASCTLPRKIHGRSKWSEINCTVDFTIDNIDYYDFTSLGTAWIFAWGRGPGVYLAISTLTHGILTSSQQLPLPWFCVAIGYKTLGVRFDAKFHARSKRSEINSTSNSVNVCVRAWTERLFIFHGILTAASIPWICVAIGRLMYAPTQNPRAFQVNSPMIA